MQRITHESLAYYQFESLQDTGVQQGIFTRLGGVSAGIYASLNLSRSTGDTLPPVLENRRRMFEALGLRVRTHSHRGWYMVTTCGSSAAPTSVRMMRTPMR